MTKIKHIAVLGGTGFLGRNLILKLSQAGYLITIPTREKNRHRDLLVYPNVRLLQANVHRKENLQDVLRDCDAVINLIGVLHDTKRKENSFSGAHVELAQSIIQTCQELGIKRYLHMSSLTAHAEDAPSEYLRSKGKAQNIVLASDLNVSIFQPSVIFGPNDSFTNRFAQLIKWPLPFFSLPSPNARFAPVFVEDVSHAILKSIDNRMTYGKIFSCCGPTNYSLRELIELIAATLGKKRIIIGLNDTLSKLAASVLGVMPRTPFTKDNYLSMQVDNVCQDNGLLSLGIKPASLESKIKQILLKPSINYRYDDYRRSAARK